MGYLWRARSEGHWPVPINPIPCHVWQDMDAVAYYGTVVYGRHEAANNPDIWASVASEWEAMM